MSFVNDTISLVCERNRQQVDSGRAELQLRNNFSEECSSMYKKFLANRNCQEMTSKRVGGGGGGGKTRRPYIDSSW